MCTRSALVALLALAVLAIPSATDPVHAEDDLVDRHTRVMYDVQRDPATGKTVANVKETVVDAAGNVISTVESVVESVRRPLAQTNVACIYDRDRPGFKAHFVVEQLDKRKNEFVHFQYFPYSQRQARFRNGLERQQWLVCASGGADASNGSRLTMSGPVIAYRDKDVTYKLGQRWKEGRTPPSHQVTLGFEVGKDPVHVTGSITQNAAEFLKGSPLAPSDRHDNAYAANQVAGWWEHGCLPVCRRWNGSADHQGSVVEGLWEFPDSATVRQEDFYYGFSMQHHCSNPFGC